MIGVTNEKTALTMPVPETKPLVDNLFQRKENTGRESGPTDFENYLKAAATDKRKPFRETSSKSVKHQANNRWEERVERKTMDSPKQVVKEDKDLQKNAVQKDTDDKGEVSTTTPEQTAVSDTASQTEDAQTASDAEVQALSLTPVAQIQADNGTQPAETLNGVQSVDTLVSEDLVQPQVSLSMVSMDESMNNPTGETTVNNQQNANTGQTVTTQSPVDALSGLAQDSNSAAGQTVTTFNQGLTEAMKALLGADSSQKKDGSQNTSGNQQQTKTSATESNGFKGTVLNKAVLEVFQDKVTAQAAIQNLTQSKDELQQSLQNAVTGKTVITGVESKPVNLAVLQTQLAVGDNLDQTSNSMITPLQQQQLAGGQFQEITQGTVHSTGKEQLFTQIMEHAKLMLSGNQSELEMSLKPDHLGKLQLKVLVENQVVTARFVAESQQVKQIIETNLNQLRDQLRESGLMVDHLSVSVGTGGQEQFFNQTAGNQSQFSGNGNSHSYSDGINDGSMDGETVATPKSLQETVVDLIA